MKIKKGVYALKSIFLLITLFGIMTYFDSINHLVALTFHIFFICLFIFILNHTHLDTLFITSIVTVGLNYLLFTISAIIVSVCLGLLNINKSSDFIIPKLIAAIIQILLTHLLFKIKRFNKGMPFLYKNYKTIIFYICLLVFLGYTLITFNIPYIETVLLMVFFIAFAIIIFISWKKQIQEEYVKKINLKHIRTLEFEIQNQAKTIHALEEDIKEISKIVHKDNKLIPSLEMAVVDFLENNTNSEYATNKGNELLKNIKNIATERAFLLSTQIFEYHKAVTTNIISIDALLNYMFSKSREHQINFKIKNAEYFETILNNPISESDITTLMADLIENAFISTYNTSTRNVLLDIGKIDNINYINILDSGIPFSTNVLNSFGKKRYTNYKNKNGHGIGLMTTYEFLNKYNASFILEEYQNNVLYTKKIRILFDNNKNLSIYSYRYEELKENIKDNLWDFIIE